MRTSKIVPSPILRLIELKIIKPEKVNKSDRYPTIGVNPKTGEWYAWNKTAFNMYRIGSKVPVGSCAYNEKRGAWVAETVEDAKQMAIDFAKNLAPK